MTETRVNRKNMFGLYICVHCAPMHRKLSVYNPPLKRSETVTFKKESA